MASKTVIRPILDTFDIRIEIKFFKMFHALFFFIRSARLSCVCKHKFKSSEMIVPKAKDYFPVLFSWHHTALMCL